MICTMENAAPHARSEAAGQIKAAALRLFAQRGIDGVTVRQIAEAAGQKNHAALTYHFGSKEALIRELIVDGARAIDIRRNAWLDAAEAAGGPDDILEVMRILVRTSVAAAPLEEGESYNRFIMGLQNSNRALFMESLGGTWNSGYQRCLKHIRKLLPSIPAATLNRRLVFMGMALGGIMAGRESELADTSRAHAMWSKDDTLDDIAVALTHLVQQADQG